jgi:hypothetical protein
MAVSVVVEFEATPEQYDQVNEKLGMPDDNVPEGLIVHTGAEIGGGKMRVIDIWDSQEAYGKFAEERLGPAIGEVMGPDGPQAAPEITELREVIKP